MVKEFITSITGMLPRVTAIKTGQIHNNLNMRRRKICFIITSFIHYSRNLLILDELRKRPDVELHIIIGGAALLAKYSSKYAHVREVLTRDGFGNLHEVYFNLEGDNGVTKAKTIGLGIIEFASFMDKISPDLVIVRGDRFEVLAAAIAASNLNIPIAHIEGGDITGSIDESVRHAITKLAHIHFATNEQSKKRIIKMGERKNYVFNFGSPDIEVVDKLLNSKKNKKNPAIDFIKKTGSGADINLADDFLMVMYHPVTTQIEKIAPGTRNLLAAVYEANMPTLWFWPNYDAGAEEISREIRIFNDTTKNHKIKFMRYLPPKEFLHLLQNAKCLVGNSSAGIKECSYLGVPAVDVSSRQHKRMRADNVMFTQGDARSIKKAIKMQIKRGRYPKSRIYHASNTSKRIAAKLATIKLYVQKEFGE